MISIGLCMIVKNEEAVLRRILTPMSKLVDKIYICDTGSVDKTKEIAREFTDEVYDFLWSDDFSAARNFRWQGRVHETVVPAGNILYSDVVIEHRKIKAGESFRNLHIYEQMIDAGEKMEPRHFFYYGRELFYHKQYEYAILILKKFLEEPDGWIEDKLNSCLVLSCCYQAMGENAAAFDILFYSFTMDVPRAEICCEIGRLFMEKREYVTAAYWYQQALLAPRKKKNGGFYIADSHDFIPAIQMCVCLDKAGRHREAFEFHKKARVLKPLHQAVIGNEKYFRDVWGME